VRLIPAPRGAGIVAARVPKKVLQMAGIDDCYTASRGSTKTLGNFVKVLKPNCLLRQFACSKRCASGRRVFFCSVYSSIPPLWVPVNRTAHRTAVQSLVSAHHMQLCHLCRRRSQRCRPRTTS
jgi:Ribosomal protein S5, C-terminal domain